MVKRGITASLPENEIQKRAKSKFQNEMNAENLSVYRMGVAKVQKPLFISDPNGIKTFFGREAFSKK